MGLDRSHGLPAADIDECFARRDDPFPAGDEWLGDLGEGAAAVQDVAALHVHPDQLRCGGADVSVVGFVDGQAVSRLRR